MTSIATILPLRGVWVSSLPPVTPLERGFFSPQTFSRTPSTLPPDWAYLGPEKACLSQSLITPRQFCSLLSFVLCGFLLFKRPPEQGRAGQHGLDCPCRKTRGADGFTPETELTSAWSRADEAQPVPSLLHTPGSSFSLVLGPQPLGEAAALPRCCPWWAQHQVHLGLSS